MTIDRKIANSPARKAARPAGGSPAIADGMETPHSGAAGPVADATAGPVRIDPLAMTVAQAAKVLSAVGLGTVTEEMIRRHIAAGAPVTSGPDGHGVRINLVHYAAWLNLPANGGRRMGEDLPDPPERRAGGRAGWHGT